MAGNAIPIFSKVADVQWSAAAITAANTAKDGTGTVTTVFTADATNGGWVEELVVMPLGTNVQSVLRVFVNNGSATTTAANNAMIEQVNLPPTTNTETAPLLGVRVPIRRALPPGYKLTVVLGTAVSAGVIVTAVGGKY